MPGRSRTIIWEISKDFPQGLDDEQYSIELQVEEEGGGLAWYYYVGAAVVAGSAAAFLAGSSSSDGGTTPATILIGPPGRPGD